MANDFLKTKQRSKKIDEITHTNVYRKYGKRGGASKDDYDYRTDDNSYNPELAKAITVEVVSEEKKSVDGNLTPEQIEKLSSGTKGLLTGIKGVSEGAAKTLEGKKKENKTYKKYPDLDDKELATKLRRIQMEQQYSDLTGDTIVTKTGSEKAKDVLQTIGAVAGIGASLVGIGYAIYQMRRGGGGNN